MSALATRPTREEIAARPLDRQARCSFVSCAGDACTTPAWVVRHYITGAVDAGCHAHRYVTGLGHVTVRVDLVDLEGLG